MLQSSGSNTVRRGTPRASLAALGCYLRQLDFFAPIRTAVHIAQKTVRYSPDEKLYDCFISLLTGAQTTAEVNTRLRPDPALQTAFGLRVPVACVPSGSLPRFEGKARRWIQR